MNDEMKKRIKDCYQTMIVLLQKKRKEEVDLVIDQRKTETEK